MRALLLAALTATTACFVPAQRGTPTTYSSPTTNGSGSTASVGGVGQATQPVLTSTGVATTTSSAALVPTTRREPTPYFITDYSAYVIDPLSHSCTLVYGGGRAVNSPVAIPVDCAVLKANLPQVAYLIDWLPAPAAAPVAP